MFDPKVKTGEDEWDNYTISEEIEYNDDDYDY